MGEYTNDDQINVDELIKTIQKILPFHLKFILVEEGRSRATKKAWLTHSFYSCTFFLIESELKQKASQYYEKARIFTGNKLMESRQSRKSY